MKEILLKEFVDNCCLCKFNMFKLAGTTRIPLSIRVMMSLTPLEHEEKGFICRLEFDEIDGVHKFVEFDEVVYMADHTNGFLFPDATPWLFSNIGRETLLVHMIHSCKHEIVVDENGVVTLISGLITRGSITATTTPEQLKLMLS